MNAVRRAFLHAVDMAYRLSRKLRGERAVGDERHPNAPNDSAAANFQAWMNEAEKHKTKTTK